MLARPPTVVLVSTVRDREISIDRLGISPKLFQNKSAQKANFREARPPGCIRTPEIGQFLEPFENRQGVRPIAARQMNTCLGKGRERFRLLAFELVPNGARP